MRATAMLLATAGLLCLSSGARAEWPERAIQMIVPFPAGGTVNVVARKFAQSLSAQLRQPVAVINRDGGSGTIGTTAVMSSAPDGYTVGFIPNGPLTVQPTLNRKVTYTLSHFKPICQVFSYPYVLAVRADSEHRSLKDLLAAAKASPKETTYAFGGVGTAPHFAMLQLAQVSKTKFLGIPYRGDPPAAVGLKAGEVESAVLTVEVARQLGFRILAIFAEQRSPVLPQVPTAREQGADVVSTTYAGLVASAATPPQAVRTLEAACAAAARGNEFREGMKQLGQTTSHLSGERLESILRADTEIKRRLIESSGIRLE